MWRKYLKTLASVLVLALVFTMFVPIEKTDASSLYGFSQSAIYSNQIVLNINSNRLPKGSVVNWEWEMTGNNGTSTVNLKPRVAISDNKVTITNVSSAYRYGFTLYCDYYDSYGSLRTHYYVGSASNISMAPSKVTGLKQTNWYCYICSLRADWNKQMGTTGYQYELYNYKNAKIRTGNCTEPYSSYASLSNLVLQTYKMRVRAYTTFNGKTTYGAWSNLIEIVPPVKSLTGKAKKKKVSLKWSKVPGATSYTIFVSTKKDSGYKATKTVKKNKVTIKKIGKKKLKSKKTYYIYVRPNRKVNGKDVFRTFANSSTIILYGRVR